MRRHRTGSLGNCYHRASCPAGSGIWKLPNRTTAFLSKNQKHVNQLWKIKAAEPTSEANSKPLPFATVPHKEQTARNFTSRPATSSKTEHWKRSYLFGKRSTGMAPYFSFSGSINLSIYLPLPPSNSLIVKPKPLTTPILLNSDHMTLHYLLLPRTSPSWTPTASPALQPTCTSPLG